MPWTWWAFLTLFLSGMVFVIARPDRYFSNPIAGWKLVLLLPTVLTALWLQWPVRSQPDYWQQTRARQRVAQVFAAIILLLLIGIIFAGRWIAYTDYLYWE